MFSNEKTIILRVAENYLKTGIAEDSEVTVTCLPPNKTSALEQVDGENHSIMLDEFTVDGEKIWAAYSSRKQMVYLSLNNYQ